MKVALYARVSTDKQTEKYGIPSQVEALRKRCLEKGWTAVLDGDKDVFVDDGYSGAELDRPALNRLRRAARDGAVDVVLAYDPDRLSRKLYHQMILAEELEKQGIKLEFITQEMGTSPEDRMFFNMRGLVAEYEREKIRERTMRGSREKARQGKVVSPGSVPFGFRYANETCTLEEDLEKAQVVRLIFHTFANENLSVQKLADRLNRLHIPTSKRRGRWRASTLWGMLRNEAYVGRWYQFRQYRVEPKRKVKALTKSRKTCTTFRPREEWIPARVPSLVMPDLFEKVQQKLRRNAELSKRNTKREYLLSGLLYCTDCGSRMGGHTIHGISYYRCYRKGNPERFIPGADGELHPCSCPEIRTDSIEPVVWDTISELIKNPNVLIEELHRRNAEGSETRAISEHELRLCETRLASIPAEQQRLVEGYRKGLYADFMMREEMEAVQKEQHELEKRKADLERQLAKWSLTQDQESQIRSMAERINQGLDNLDFGGRQELLRLLVDKVLYKGQSVEIHTIISLDDQLHPIQRGGTRG